MRTHSPAGKNTRLVFLLILLGVLATTGSWQQGLAQKGSFRTAGSQAGEDNFGHSVALSGDRALVGAHHNNENGEDSGAAYIFERQADGTWRKVTRLGAHDAVSFDYFGLAVSLSGRTAIVCAPRSHMPLSTEHGISVGALYVFEEQADGAWQEVSKLYATPPEAGLGHTATLSGDRALVTRNSRSSMIDSGAVYVAERLPDGTWHMVTKLFPAGVNQEHSGIGSAVALEGDRALLGAPAEYNSYYRGAAYIFERQPDGTWLETTRLTATDGGDWDEFGGAVALSGDRALIGARENEGSGSAYVFERQPDGTWTQVAKLLGSGTEWGDNFGRVVALSGDQALVGAPYQWRNGVLNGSAYVFERQPDGTWPETARLTASDASRSWFGNAVALSEGRALVGDSFHSNNGSIQEGAAYVFEQQPDGSWTETAKLTPGDTTAVLSFTLIDAETDQPVPGFDPIPDGATLDLATLPPLLTIRANATADTRSVDFIFYEDNLPGRYRYEEVFRTEKAAPFALFGDVDGNYAAGRFALSAYTLKAIPHAVGAGYPLEVHFTVAQGGIGPIAVTRFVLVDADTDQDLFELEDKTSYNLATLPPRLNVRADVSGPVRSVHFTWSWRRHQRVENTAPYVLFGDTNGDYLPGSITSDEDLYVLAVPYVKPEGRGVRGALLELTADFYHYEAAKTPAPGEAAGSFNEINGIPVDYTLAANYPNPFNPTTVIAFSLPDAVAVHVAVYDLLGRQVALLVDGPLPAGRHEVTFDGAGLPSGLYLYRLQAPGQTFVRRMHLLK